MVKRISTREQRRLKTLNENHTPEEIRQWRSKAGKASPSKFTSSSAKNANAIRWAAWRAAQAEKEKQLNKEV